MEALPVRVLVSAPMPQVSSSDTRDEAAFPAPAKSLVRKVATGAAWMVGVRMASRTLGLVSTLVVARILVPADFGLVAMATAFSQSVNAISEVGLRDALIRHPEESNELYDTAFTMQVIRGFLTAGALVAAAPFVGGWFGDPRVSSILLVLAGIAALSGFENIAIAGFRRNFRFDMEFALQIAPRVLQVATAIIAALLLRNYWALLIAISVSAISRLAATYIVLPHRPRFTLRRWRDLFGFAFWTWACSVAKIAWERSDAFIIAPALGATAFGLYSLAWEVGWLPVTELISPAMSALFPGFAEARRRGDPDALAPMAVTAFLTLLTVPMTIALSAAAGPVVAVLLGPSWHAARLLVSIAAIYCVVAPFAWVSASLLLASGRVARYFVVILVSAALRIAMLVYAVRGGSLLVVSWWSIASLVCEAAAFSVVLGMAGEVRLRDGAVAILRSAVAGAACLLAVWATGWGWHSASATSALSAFVEGTGIGLFAIAVFALFVALLWLLSGRPEGPERRVIGLVAGGRTHLAVKLAR